MLRPVAVEIESQRSISAHRLSAARSIPLAPLSPFGLLERLPQTPYTRLAYCPMNVQMHGEGFNGLADDFAKISTVNC
jgi:hypothetical protein